MVTAFTLLIFVQFAVVASHDLINIPGWVHGSQVQAHIGKRKIVLATLINAIFPGIAAGFALYFWHRSRPFYVPDYWVVYCTITLLSAIGMWYVPYLRGASEKYKNDYLTMYAGTRQILPPRGDNPRPNVFHLGLHFLFIATFCLSLALRFHHR